MNTTDVLTYCQEMLGQTSKVEYMQTRNIVSRAYYFAYYECINHVENRLGWKETISKGGVHVTKISKLLDKEGAANAQRQEEAALLHNRINNLKKLRVRADYKLELDIPRHTAQYCVIEAGKIGIELSNL